MLGPSTREAIRAAVEGDLHLLLGLRPATAIGSSDRAALDAVAYLAGAEPERPSIPTRRSDAALYFASIAVVERSASMLRAALAVDSHVDPIRTRAYELWLDLEGPVDPDKVAATRALEAEAARSRRAVLVVELASLRAASELRLGRTSDAVVTGRRASRMSRTEGLLQQEILANVILARIRRAAGRPHLALRILAALRRVASQPWIDWIDSERFLSGAQINAASGRTGSWVDAIAAARRGDRQAFDRAISRLARDTDSATTREDAAVLQLLVDPARDPASGPERAAAWRRGVTHMAPGGLHAVIDPRESGGTATDVAYVLLSQDGTATRISSLGLSMLGRSWLTQPVGSRRGSRVQISFPTLASAGAEGLCEGDLFAAVYGFGFRKELHQNALNILLHRVRGALIPQLTLVRDKGRVRLVSTTLVAVPDARCDCTVEDRVLRFLSEHSSATAKDTAKSLGVSLRRAQGLLETLVGEGTCIRQGAGRATRYLVEDTTFREYTETARDGQQ